MVELVKGAARIAGEGGLRQGLAGPTTVDPPVALTRVR